MSQRLKPLSALAACVALSQVLLAGWHDDASRGTGIAYLTQELYEQAIACGRSGRECAVTRYQLCPGDIKQYSVSIATPFSRVAYSVFERASRRQRARPMERGPANVWGLGVYVSPAADYAGAASVERVVLKRDGRTIEPTTATLAPVTVAGDGQSMQLVRGYFAFPMEVLSPRSDVTVVVTGAQGDVTCTLSREELMTLQ
jgi:hypothetical protein